MPPASRSGKFHPFSAARPSSFAKRILGPGVAWIAAVEFVAHLRVMALPEAGQIGGYLHGALVGRQQVHHNRRLAACDTRRFPHAEEILKARGHPGRLVRGVMEANPVSARQAEALGRHPIEQRGAASQPLLERPA